MKILMLIAVVLIFAMVRLPDNKQPQAGKPAGSGKTIPGKIVELWREYYDQDKKLGLRAENQPAPIPAKSIKQSPTPAPKTPEWFKKRLAEKSPLELHPLEFHPDRKK